ncbi:ATP-binding protein [Ferrimonas aestuarii]|uniref:histidine kinase n=1 Tax=Ferrimonas aestuarii TaxID=2569539 RepID=A0A4U1BRK2_9GAMM|nr:transporter substrate-binding domain-containing protein [Ferrimonas aestuarii]TKB56049.1 transporter substrate-binding domain-containing protein [Ferrimonas aestuarii]
MILRTFRLLLMLPLVLSWNARADIVYGIDHDFAPYEWINEQGEPEGFNIDLMRQIAEQLNETLVIVPGPWRKVMQDFNASRINVVAIGISPDGGHNPGLTPDFEAYPFSLAYSHIYSHKHAPGIRKLSDLSGLTVALNRGSYTEFAFLNSGINAQVLYADSERQTIELVSDGLADAALANAVIGRDTLARYPTAAIASSGLPLFPRSYAYAIKNQDKWLQQGIHDALNQLSNDGSLFKLRQHWFSTTERIRRHQQLTDNFINITAAGVLFFFAVLVWNVTLRRSVNRHTAELKRQSAIAEDKAKMATLGIISAGIAHEINNPNGIIMQASQSCHAHTKRLLTFLKQTPGLELDLQLHQLNLEAIANDSEQQHQQLHLASKKIANIVKELKDYARPTPATEFQPLQLNELFQSTQLLCNSLSNSHRIPLKVESSELDIRVIGNKARLEQVLVNLIDNGMRACPKQGGEIRVTAKVQAQHAVIEVIDNGHGMSEQTLANATEGFFTTRRTEGGLGLGLAICKRIMLEHNGKLVLQSQPEQGTCVQMWLPINKE